MRTTLNLSTTDIEKIRDIADSHKITTTEVVKLVISKVIKTTPMLEDFSTCIRYQDDDPSLRCFHIQFTQIEYEQNLDLKKVFKLSLSLLVSLSLFLFGDGFTDLLDEHLSTNDNTSRSVHNLDSYSNNHYYYVSFSDSKQRVLFVNWKYRRE